MTNVAFSRLEGEPSLVSSSKKHKLPSDPTQALAKLQKQNAKIETLAKEKREVVTEKQKWEKAAIRMEGGKVRDDETRLKKAVKRKEKEKTRSKRDWFVTQPIHLGYLSSFSTGMIARNSSPRIWQLKQRSVQTISPHDMNGAMPKAKASQRKDGLDSKENPSGASRSLQRVESSVCLLCCHSIHSITQWKTGEQEGSSERIVTS
jgi:hypothetical protein